MKLTDYLDGMRTATTAEELEAAIQAPYKHHFRGRTWSQICKVRTELGERICAAHPHGFYVPRYGQRRRLTVCGKTYRVASGGNSTGVRYAWHGAGEWAMGLLRQHSFSIRASHTLWDGWSDYPHRALAIVDAALNGRIPDPERNVLIKHKRFGEGRPIRYTAEQNDAATYDRRASRPCQCGGTLFDWGGGHSLGFNYVNWHCNACPGTFTEYMTRAQFYQIRQTGTYPEDLVVGAVS